MKLCRPNKRILILIGIGVILLSLIVIFKMKSRPAQRSKDRPLASATVPKRENESARRLAQWLIRRGNEDVLSGRHSTAIRRWELALFLDNKNQLAQVKLEKGRELLEKKVETEYTQGLYAFKFLHFDQAIEHWQRVLQLIIDPKHPRYQEAANGILQAKEKLKRRGF